MGLWEVLEEGGDPRDVANVRELVDYAGGKLMLVRETFPDYTLHDRQHAENVITLVEQLLGDGLEVLSPLEAAMLVLAAYFHDIGMVYSRDEMTQLVDDQDFQDFLDDDSTAYVRTRQAGEVPPDVLLQYCRARHADRIDEHLYKIDPKKLTWKGAGLTKALVDLCRSHNRPRTPVLEPSATRNG
jgi:hypothetical protein